MRKYKVGERVTDEYLGDDTVVEQICSGLDKRLIIAYIVLFDKTPDYRYNMATNPALVFADSVTRIDNAETKS